ncbi:MAG TPA: TIGR02679 family protein [Dermatophilaceae bacterium]
MSSPAAPRPPTTGSPAGGQPGPMPAQLAAYLAAPALAPVWAACRARLEGNDLNVSGAVKVDLDEAGARALSGLRVPVRAGHRKVRLADLDDALRASMGARGLLAVLVELGGPLTNRRASAAALAADRADLWLSLDEQLVGAGLAGAGWAGPWLAGVRSSGLLTRARAVAPSAVRSAVAVLTVLAGRQPLGEHDVSVLRAGLPAPAAFEIGELATATCGGDAHGLGDDRVAGALVLRALAAAYGQPVPSTGSQRRALWTVAGVAPDEVSGTVLLWGFRPPGPGPWAAMMSSRAEMGLVTHVTLQEWEATAGGQQWARQGQVVFACENPQVLQAAARAGAGTPLCCTSGNPATVALVALETMVAAGVDVMYHGDFDVEGVAIAGRLFSRGVKPWRFGAPDYISALESGPGGAADFQLPLAGPVGPTPWDTELAAVMDERGLAVHEEALLGVLLGDLGKGTAERAAG